MILNRYLLREISHTFFAVILVVLLIAISNKVVRLIAKAAMGDIAPSVLLQLIFFQIPELLAFLLPISLFLAILICFSRFFADNEIPVMLACGISWQRLVLLSVSLGGGVMLMAGILTCYWGPKLEQYREHLLAEEGPMLLIQTVAPGRFHAFQQDKLIFYVADLIPNRSKLKRIFIAEQPKGNVGEENWSLLTARFGKIFTDPSGLTYVKLENGWRYNGTPGQKDYSVLQFANYQRLIESAVVPEKMLFHRTMPTLKLLSTPNPGNNAELQWRLSIPLSALLLAFLAVPLSGVAPRAGKFTRLFIAVIICIVYYNLLTVSKRWVANQVLDSQIGVWWVHALLLLFALSFLAHSSGRANQAIQWFKQRQ